jgi:hypothetical protein
MPARLTLLLNRNFYGDNQKFKEEVYIMPKTVSFIENVDITTSRKRSQAVEQIISLLGHIYVDEREYYIETTGFGDIDPHKTHDENKTLYYLYSALISLMNTY